MSRWIRDRRSIPIEILNFKVIKNHRKTSIPFLFGSYGDNHGEQFQKFMKKDKTELNEEDLDLFLNQTKPDVQIIACKFLNSDCRHDWEDILTVYG